MASHAEPLAGHRDVETGPSGRQLRQTGPKADFGGRHGAPLATGGVGASGSRGNAADRGAPSGGAASSSVASSRWWPGECAAPERETGTVLAVNAARRDGFVRPHRSLFLVVQFRETDFRNRSDFAKIRARGKATKKKVSFVLRRDEESGEFVARDVQFVAEVDASSPIRCSHPELRGVVTRWPRTSNSKIRGRDGEACFGAVRVDGTDAILSFHVNEIKPGTPLWRARDANAACVPVRFCRLWYPERKFQAAGLHVIAPAAPAVGAVRGGGDARMSRGAIGATPTRVSGLVHADASGGAGTDTSTEHHGSRASPVAAPSSERRVGMGAGSSPPATPQRTASRPMSWAAAAKGKPGQQSPAVSANEWTTVGAKRAPTRGSEASQAGPEVPRTRPLPLGMDPSGGHELGLVIDASPKEGGDVKRGRIFCLSADLTNMEFNSSQVAEAFRSSKSSPALVTFKLHTRSNGKVGVRGIRPFVPAGEDAASWSGIRPRCCHPTAIVSHGTVVRFIDWQGGGIIRVDAGEGTGRGRELRFANSDCSFRQGRVSAGARVRFCAVFDTKFETTRATCVELSTSDAPGYASDAHREAVPGHGPRPATAAAGAADADRTRVATGVSNAGAAAAPTPTTSELLDVANDEEYVEGRPAQDTRHGFAGEGERDTEHRPFDYRGLREPDVPPGTQGRGRHPAVDTTSLLDDKLAVAGNLENSFDGEVELGVATFGADPAASGMGHALPGLSGVSSSRASPSLGSSPTRSDPAGSPVPDDHAQHSQATLVASTLHGLGMFEEFAGAATVSLAGSSASVTGSGLGIAAADSAFPPAKDSSVTCGRCRRNSGEVVCHTCAQNGSPGTLCADCDSQAHAAPHDRRARLTGHALAPASLAADAEAVFRENDVLRLRIEALNNENLKLQSIRAQEHAASQQSAARLRDAEMAVEMLRRERSDLVSRLRELGAFP